MIILDKQFVTCGFCLYDTLPFCNPAEIKLFSIPTIDFFFFLVHSMRACGILVPWSGIEPVCLYSGSLESYHWTSRKVFFFFLIDCLLMVSTDNGNIYTCAHSASTLTLTLHWVFMEGFLEEVTFELWLEWRKGVRVCPSPPAGIGEDACFPYLSNANNGGIYLLEMKNGQDNLQLW